MYVCLAVCLDVPPCDCGQRQTTNHIVNTRALTKFEGELNLPQEADDDNQTAGIYNDHSARLAK